MLFAFTILRFGGDPFSGMNTFLKGIALLAILLFVFRFLAKGNKDNIDEVPEVEEDDSASDNNVN